MQKSMDNLAARIRQDLNEYQAQVQARLEKLLTQGLVSQTQLKDIVIDAQITGKSVIEALNSQNSEEVTEIYIYKLFDRYKNVVEKKIADIERGRFAHSAKIENLNQKDNIPRVDYQVSISSRSIIGFYLQLISRGLCRLVEWDRSPILKLFKKIVEWDRSPILKLFKKIVARFQKQSTQNNS